MLEFSWIWAFLLLPLPLLARVGLPASEQRQAALKVADLNHFVGDSHHSSTSPASPLRWVLPLLIWCSLVTALARPIWVGEPVRLPAEGRDLMLAVDISGSMDTADMVLNDKNVNRLTVVKKVVDEFISARDGDRIGLILFGSNAYLQSPLTFDRETVRTFMQESALGLAGKMTAIGDAVALGVKRMRDNPAGNQVIVLLTDGANTAGNIEPLRAADLAAELGVKVYSIGLGADSMKVPSFFGSRTVNPSSDLDEATLQTLAERTGGRFFRARNTEELNQIYDLIDELEPTERDKKVYRPERDVFFWPLAFALCLSALLLVTLRWPGLFERILQPLQKAMPQRSDES